MDTRATLREVDYHFLFIFKILVINHVYINLNIVFYNLRYTENKNKITLQYQFEKI